MSARILPFRRPDIPVTPGSAAEAALDWLASRVSWRAPAEPGVTGMSGRPAQSLGPGEIDDVLDGAAGATLVELDEDLVVLAREFADGTLDVLVGQLDETGTLCATRRTPLGRGRLLAKTGEVRAVMADALARARGGEGAG